MAQTCASRMVEHFGLSSHEDLAAAETLCRPLYALYVSGQTGNSTAIAQTFSGICCSNTTNLEIICKKYLSELHLPLNCMHRHNSIAGNHLGEYDTATYLMMALFIPTGLVGNLLILYAIFKLRCLPRQTGYFLSSLALGDLGVIIQFLVFFVYNKSSVHLSDKWAEFLIPSLDIFVAAVSLLQITVISIERAVAVTWPLKYPSYISAKRAKTIVFILWFVSFLLFCYSLSRVFITSQLYQLVTFYTTITLLLFLPILIIITSYTFVLVCAYKNLSQDRKRMKMLTILIRSASRNSATAVGVNNSNNNIDGEKECPEKKKKKMRFNSIRCREIKLAINVAMIVLPFLGCWGYFLAAHLYEALTDRTITGAANWMIVIAPFLVSCLNPLLYLIFTRSLRNAVKSLIKRNVQSKLSRTELSVITLSTLNSRRPSSTASFAANNRKIGRDFSGVTIQKDENDLTECLMKLSNYER